MTTINVSTTSAYEIDIRSTRIAVDVSGGQPGPAGPQGPPGAGGYVGFTYTQSSPAATWTINHSLGRYPAAVNIIIDNELVDTDIEFPTIGQIVVTFSNPKSGIAEIT